MFFFFVLADESLKKKKNNSKIKQMTNFIAILYFFSQDYEEYQRKQPSLLGEGPQPPAQQPPIMPPTVGYVTLDQIIDKFQKISYVLIVGCLWWAIP